ncbi:hypothetical protein H0H87_009748 [Tephrocybe sp. NHM501043]|nr:hypothetical protein H0H87_009748 [Tephrocybe sp. NHM501043]
MSTHTYVYLILHNAVDYGFWVPRRDVNKDMAFIRDLLAIQGTIIAAGGICMHVELCGIMESKNRLNKMGQGMITGKEEAGADIHAWEAKAE